MQCPNCQANTTEGSAFCDACGTKLQAPSDPMVGRSLLNQYMVKRKLGEGGFGAVYEAEQPSMGRKVAIKTLHKHLTHDPKMVVRFRREGLAASKLQHPSSVKMFNLGETEDGYLWIAMEFLEGETLDARIRKRGPLSEAELVELMGPVCEALNEAHTKGIIHRDLKPENIMLVPFLDKIVPKVLDFGISKLLEEGAAATQAGIVSGTPAYMPPEQWQGLTHTDARSDIYALGLIAYQALSARLPFEANTAPAWMQKHVLEPPKELSQVLTQPASAGVCAAIMKAIQKDPAARWATTLEFKAALEAGLKGAPVAAPVLSGNATAMLGAPPQLMPTMSPNAPGPTVVPQSAPPAMIANPAPTYAPQPLMAPPTQAPNTFGAVPPSTQQTFLVAPVQRDFTWRLRNSLWILWIFSIVFNWVAFLVIGSKTQTKRWLIWGAIYAAPLVLSFLSPGTGEVTFDAETMSYQEEYSYQNLIALGWIMSFIHALLARNEYLHLLASQEDAKRQR